MLKTNEDQCTKMLRVRLNPVLKWKDEFEHARKEMNESTKKLIRN